MFYHWQQKLNETEKSNKHLKMLIMKIYLFTLSLGILFSMTSCDQAKNKEKSDQSTQVSLPELPDSITELPAYEHDYHQALVYKISNIEFKDYKDVVLDFEEALEMFKTINEITGGLKQIAYFFGWQYDRYPTWGPVQPGLKREEDPDARASFIWLAEQARKYNTYVSVHINMSDAYKVSPLWAEYEKKNLIERDENGSLQQGRIWGGERSYYINKEKEWESGLAQRRIDKLLEYLPFLKESATVHIDAFGMTSNDSLQLQNVFNILDYWKSKGIDVTTEYFDFNLIGRIPYAYHLNLHEDNRLKYPPSVITGGGDYGNMRNKHNDKIYRSWAVLPEAGTLYEEAWGISVDREFRESRGKLKNIVERICTKTLQWYFLNRHRALSNYIDNENYSVTFTDGVKTHIRRADRHLTIRDGERILVDGANIFMPALWTDGEWFAFNKTNEAYSWPIPEQWKGAKELKAVRLTDHGRTEIVMLPVEDGKITIEPLDGEAFAISYNN